MFYQANIGEKIEKVKKILEKKRMTRMRKLASADDDDIKDTDPANNSVGTDIRSDAAGE